MVALWGGFVFINPDPDAISFEEYAGPEMIEHYRKFKLENRYKHAHVGKVIKACGFRGHRAHHCGLMARRIPSRSRAAFRELSAQHSEMIARNFG